ncbi:helix-turn-helix domain-containing protein [Pseudoalteromonas spongiae]|uniref:helix-turn-helix domain-containing protein n=1 Tax=Pseudoalteromonas spongiae TaxID=298657 RepID=UPI000C2D2161|nr:helix-turn-helix transcriptional regulator [Pseudoalteromonas spongiae]
MKTIFEHTQSNVLVIPQALYAMKDVTVLSHHRNSAIFYKNLEQDLANIEFYTNIPCFIYIENGREVITNSNKGKVELNAGSSIFLPQGLNLLSDFVKETESLKAYLVFFDDDVVNDYLSKVKKPLDGNVGEESFFLIDGGDEFTAFFDSIRLDIKAPTYLNIKLQELLHLIAWKDNQHILNSLLAKKIRVAPKRNLARILNTLDVFHLTVSDMAYLSGRSLSSFNRDFKESYKETPKKWLREKKLIKAKELLVSEELSVTEVAMTMGYENVSAFIKAFKLKYGVTPKQIKLRK